MALSMRSMHFKALGSSVPRPEKTKKHVLEINTHDIK